MVLKRKSHIQIKTYQLFLLILLIYLHPFLSFSHNIDPMQLNINNYGLNLPRGNCLKYFENFFFGIPQKHYQITTRRITECFLQPLSP
jgi:hypothetical protein